MPGLTEGETREETGAGASAAAGFAFHDQLLLKPCGLTHRRLLEEYDCRYVRYPRHGGHEIWRCPGKRPLSVPKNLKGERTLLNKGRGNHRRAGLIMGHYRAVCASGHPPVF